ncbi:DUF6701 domain-containing protein [Pseudoalteromonas ulvae]|uniref:LamG-like jellyroll fold domain-containing protein n=1 Tax=Pseudoalteromonas ulvae TaxID=107327 RepID=A0A244CPE2_PSEDV|nr:DUF6701 domain-containing protein [Pseudoalteromonas ulvae]OUL57483.1 hypothetical protein B1199_10425 [Pseudoalteromonas ulvae]
MLKLKRLINCALAVIFTMTGMQALALPQCDALFPGGLATFNNSTIRFDGAASINYPSNGELITSQMTKSRGRPKCPSPTNCFASGTNAITTAEASTIPSQFKAVTGTSIPSVLNGEYYFDQQILDFSAGTTYQVNGPTEIFLRWSFNSATKAQLRVLTTNINFAAGAYLVIYVDGTVITATSSYFKGFIFTTGEAQLGALSVIDGGVTAGADITVGAGFEANQLSVPNPVPGICGSAIVHGGGVANAHYPLDLCFDVTSSTVTDLINGYLAQATNIDENSNGVIHYSADLSANTNSDYLTFQDVSMLQGKSSFAVSTWLDFSNTQALQTVLSANNPANGSEFKIELRQWQSSFYPQVTLNGQSYWFFNPLNLSGWQHLVVSVEQENVCIYINGTISECIDLTAGALSISQMVLGQTISSSGVIGGQNYIGFIDEVVFFGGSLSLAEAKAVFDNQNAGNSYDGTAAHQAPECLIGWYQFEDNLNDSSQELINNLTGIGALTYSQTNPDPAYTEAPDSTCKYLELDGSSYARVNDSNDYNQEKLTVSAWVYPTREQNELQTLVSKDEHFEFHLNNQERLYWWWTNNNRQSRSLTSNISLSLNTWSHVAVTYQAGAQRMYINGNLVASSSWSDGLFDTPCDFYIGIDTATAGSTSCGGVLNNRRFQGKIDEVKIYASALTQAKVQEDMRKVHACSLNPSIDHYRIELASTTGLTCEATNVVLKACADATCATPYANNVTGQIVATPNTEATWAPSDAFSFTEQTNLAINYLQPQSVAYSLTNLQPTSAVRCFITGSETSQCATEFKDSGFKFVNGTDNSLLPNQIAGHDFTSYLKAVEKNTTTGACQSALSGPEQVQLKINCTTPGACISDTAMNFQSNGVSLNESAFVTVSANFDPSNNDLAILNNVYPDAGRISLDAQKTVANGAVLQGTSNEFVVRPDRFEFGFEDGHAPSDNSYAIDAASSVFKKTNQAFPVTISAVNKNGVPTQNFHSSDISSGSLSLNHDLQLPVGGELGDFSPDATGVVFNNGVAAFNATWSEVGIIGLETAVASGGYLGHVDTIIGEVDHIGRFVPAAFYLDTSSVILPPMCNSGFTYLEQPFRAAFKLKALSDEANNVIVTKNYSGSLAKADIAMKLENNEPTPRYKAHDDFKDSSNVNRLEDKANQGNWVAGEYQLDENDFVLKRDSSVDGPFKAMQFVITAQDNESSTFTELKDLNENYEANDLAQACNLNTPSTCNSVRLNPSPIEFKYGRYVLADTYGSAFNAIQVPLKAEYWDNNQWKLNAVDSCSTYQQGLVQISPNAPTLSFSLQGGAGPLTLNLGEYQLGEGVVVNPLSQEQGGVFILEYDSPPVWLQYDWLGDNSQLNPRSQIQFGRYRGNDRVIYWRESN